MAECAGGPYDCANVTEGKAPGCCLINIAGVVQGSPNPCNQGNTNCSEFNDEYSLFNTLGDGSCKWYYQDPGIPCNWYSFQLHLAFDYYEYAGPNRYELVFRIDHGGEGVIYYFYDLGTGKPSIDDLVGLELPYRSGSSGWYDCDFSSSTVTVNLFYPAL